MPLYAAIPSTSIAPPESMGRLQVSDLKDFFLGGCDVAGCGDGGEERSREEPYGVMRGWGGVRYV